MRAAQAPRLRLAVLNLRMGGQVSSMASLAELLEARGLPVEFVLPEGVPAPTREALERFARRPLLARLGQLWRMLRRLPGGEDQVLHLVLPSPAFAFLCLLLRVPRSRILVQSEGLPTCWDRAHLQDLLDAPGFMLPRLLLNHQWLVRLGRLVPVSHLVPSPGFARWLKERGFRDVSCVANVSRLDAGEGGPDDRPDDLPFVREDLLVGYIGHAHRVKGVDDALEAFAQAQPRRPELALVLALSGDGDAARLRRRIRTLAPAIRERIHVTGLVSVRRLLARLDALLLPYRSLASTTIYPSLLLEADLAHCPTILADLPDLGEVVDRSSAILHLVPPRAPEAIAEAMMALPRRADGPSGGRLLVLPGEAQRLDQIVQCYRRMTHPT